MLDIQVPGRAVGHDLGKKTLMFLNMLLECNAQGASRRNFAEYQYGII